MPGCGRRDQLAAAGSSRIAEIDEYHEFWRCGFNLVSEDDFIVDVYNTDEEALMVRNDDCLVII